MVQSGRGASRPQTSASPGSVAAARRFETGDFDAAVGRGAAMNAEILRPRHRNPPDGDGGPNHRECWLRDPDGYTVVPASPDGSAG